MALFLPILYGAMKSGQVADAMRCDDDKSWPIRFDTMTSACQQLGDAMQSIISMGTPGWIVMTMERDEDRRDAMQCIGCHGNGMR